jgi:N-acetylglucosaminyldiphosphoundecaprenol N-acetyl-beta-D-mannosaminyltransferase
MEIGAVSRLSIMGVSVDAVEMDTAVKRLLEAASQPTGFGVSALAVHGLVLASKDPQLRHRINSLEMVVPDGQPVRWALNRIHDAELVERVFGPELMLQTCREAARAGLPVFLFGNTDATLARLTTKLRQRFPDLIIAGTQSSRFRPATHEEARTDIQIIRASGARIVFVGLGCPLQEIWTYENRTELGLPVVAVGAAFDYHVGNLRRAPAWMSRGGLEWLHRLSQEPSRLWRRYASTNPAFILGVTRQWAGFSYDVQGEEPRGPIHPG